jgi:hypothetical protein
MFSSQILRQTETSIWLGSLLLLQINISLHNLLTFEYLFVKICTLAMKIRLFIYVVATSHTLCKLQSLWSVCIHFIGQFCWHGNWFSFLSFHLQNSLSADVFLVRNFVLINEKVLFFSQWEMAHIVFIIRPAWNFEIGGAADNSFARHMSLCRRTKSIVSLEREVC